MTLPSRPLPTAIGIAGPVLLGSLAANRLRMPPIIRVIAPALVAFGAGLLLDRRIRARSTATATQAIARAEQAEARIGELAGATARLRHDLRGILSPAMLMADRLAMSEDPISRRAGESMIATIERADARLKPPPAPEPSA
ncbi:hypothetical protein [Lichenicola sp.]|uniref:hypothetical protein n=1 Tax=Lichenicola sp. TaxID=2804529 RepID=UPI003AFF6F10